MRILTREIDSNILEDAKIYLDTRNIDYDLDVLRVLLGQGIHINIIENILNENNHEFLYHDLLNLGEAAELIHSYITRDFTDICVFADYDSDGINSAYIMEDGLKCAVEYITEKNCTVSSYLPERSEGYGLSMSFCKQIVDHKKISKRDILVITVDNGITKKAEVKYLKENGIEVIITDHHVPQEGKVPEDVLIVDAHLNDLEDENALGLCGAAVAYKLIQYIYTYLLEEQTGYANKYLANAMIATISDMMPVTSDNVYLVSEGIKLVNNPTFSEALHDLYSFRGKDFTAKDIAFELAPMLNACGRMGVVDLGLDYLKSGDQEEARDNLIKVKAVNDARKTIESLAMELLVTKNSDANKRMLPIIHMDGDFSSEVFNSLPDNREGKNAKRFSGPDSLGGISGTIANKLTEYYDRPIILLNGSHDIIHGSARSRFGLDLQQVLGAALLNDKILDFGGHAGAAGLKIRKSQINDAMDFFDEILIGVTDEVEAPDYIEVDAILGLGDVTLATYDKYNKIHYFNELKEPIFAFKDLKVLDTKRSSNNQNNICFTVVDSTCKYSKDIWAWKFGDYYKDILKESDTITIIGNIVKDFRNAKKVTVNVIAIL